MPKGIFKNPGEHSERIRNGLLERKKRLGYINSPETRKKQSLARLGKKLSEEHKRKISLGGKGKKKPYTEEHRKKMSGSNHWNWQGGINKINSTLRGQIEALFEYRQWRSDVFTQDNFTCRQCNIRGGILNPHHIKKVSIIIKEYNIKTIEEALNCQEFWNINNGITLCQKCHKIMHKKNV